VPGAQTTDEAHDHLKVTLAGVKFDVAIGSRRLIDEMTGHSAKATGRRRRCL
jgi:hypothetical protein